MVGNQLKSVVARVMSGDNHTENGDPVDALFSWSGVDRRLVYSPSLIGTTNTLLRLISKRVADVYFGNVK